MNQFFLISFMILTILSCKNGESIALPEKEKNALIYYNLEALQEVKKRIAQGDKYYATALEAITKKADQYLTEEANPVVLKSNMPPSGDKHDYLSIAPYWWPDPSKEDGLPWIRRDGEINPQTRGENTDKQRLSKLWNAISTLTFAYYYTAKKEYAEKAIALMKIWFVDAETKVNPNANYGQGIPGRTEGRPFGIIEWTGVDEVVTAVQIFEQQDVLDQELEKEINKWLGDFLDWLLESKLGKEEGTRQNNHANWYDYQVIGLAMHLGRMEEAKQMAEAAKINRIAHQIEPDGSQPHEIARTKSLSYSTMNLKAMVLVATLAAQLDVDLLHYTSTDGRSLLKAAEFLIPYATKEKAWTHPQISAGGWEATVDNNVLPLLSMMSSIYQKPLLENKEAMKESLSTTERLKYPPLLYESN